MLPLLELGVSEDILSVCGTALGESYTKGPEADERGTMQVVGKGNEMAALEWRRWDDCLI